MNGTFPADQRVYGHVQLNLDPSGALTTATGSGVVARWTSGHYYAARMFIDGHFDVVRVDGGVETVLGSVPHPFAVDTSALLTLQVTGTDPVVLDASINGVPAYSVTDASSDRLLQGSPGLLSGPGGRTQYDDFTEMQP